MQRDKKKIETNTKLTRQLEYRQGTNTHTDTCTHLNHMSALMAF